MPGLYTPPTGGQSNFQGRAQQHAQNAIGAHSALTKKGPEPPGKTAGGAISSAAGMGMAGYMAGGMAKGGMTGPQGAMLGAGVGLLAYMLS